MGYVLDSSAIFSRHIPDGPCFITPEVEGEIRDSHSSMELGSFLASGRIVIKQASDEMKRKSNDAVLASGDALSLADISVLALALELSLKVVSDDFGIQNVAEAMGLEWISPKFGGIREQFSWGKKCMGCGKKYEASHEEECDVCGSLLRRYRKGKKIL